MPDFSTILQTPEIRAIVQQNILERAFHDALYPRNLFRGEATPVVWPQNIGDTMTFSAVGLIKPKMKPVVPGQDPTPSDYQKEQWTAQLQQYADTIDTPMPTSIVAIANLLLRNAQQLGLSAAQTLNRQVRERLYNAAMSGWTVADGAQAVVTSLRVKRLNGFTKARRPDLANGSAVLFATVSGSNPLSINAGGTTVNVIGFTSDNPGDEVGPGVLLLDAAVTVVDRAAVFASDRTFMVRVGGGNRVDDIGSNDILRMQDCRAGVARFWSMNVAEHADGRFHIHLDPTSQTQVFNDPEWQRLNTSLPDYYMYRQLAIGEMHGCIFYRNSENPLPETVGGGLTSTYDPDDPFGGELFSNGAVTGVRIHRPLLTAQDSVFEYYQDLAGLITDAGVTGKVGEFNIVNNGVEVFSERIQVIMRAPLNRLQDSISTSYKFIGDWPVRTDATTGDTARYKRVCVIEHGE